MGTAPAGEAEHLVTLLKDCLVRVRVGSQQGSGFFIAPGLVLTCAHVAGADSGKPITLICGDGGSAGEGRVWAASGPPARHGLWPYPDLAVVEFESAPSGHPCVWLDDLPAAPGAMRIAGFSRAYSSDLRRYDFVVDHDGEYDNDPGRYFSLAGKEISDGTSGAPILDPRTGGVVAVAKSAQKTGLYGGLAIPVRGLRYLLEPAQYRELWRAHHRFHATDKRWERLATTAHDGRLGINFSQEVALRAALSDIEVDGDLHSEFHEIAGRATRRPQDPLHDRGDVVTSLVELLPTAPRLPHAVVYAAYLVRTLPSSDALARLEEWCVTIAGSLKHGDELLSWLVSPDDSGPLGTPSAPVRPVYRTPNRRRLSPDEKTLVWEQILAQDRLQVAPSSESWRLLAAAPDAPWLATADGDGTLALWDTRSGLPVRSWSARSHVLSLAAGQGDLLAVGGDDGAVQVWNVRQAAVLAEYAEHEGGVQALAFDHGSTRLATGDASGVVRLWDSGGSDLRPSLVGGHSVATVLAFDLPGEQLAVATVDGLVSVWRVQTPRHARLVTRLPRASTTTALAFDEDGSRLAVCDTAGRVTIWRLPSHGFEPLVEGLRRDGRTLAMAWSRLSRSWVGIDMDGRIVAVSGDARSVPIRSLGAGRLRVAGLAFGKDDGRASGIDHRGSVRTLAIGDPDSPLTLHGSDDSIIGLHVHPADRMLVSGHADGVLRVWNPEEGILRDRIHHGSDLLAMSGAPGTGRFAVLAGSGHVTVYGIDGDGSIRSLWWATAHHAAAVAFSRDGRHVVAVGATVDLWTVDGERVGALPFTGTRTTAVAFDATGRLLATAGADGLVTVHDLNAGLAPRHHHIGHKGPVRALAFNPISGRLATAGSDGTVKIWSADSDAVHDSRSGWASQAATLAFSPFDGSLVLGCVDGTVRLHEGGEGAETQTFFGHTHGVTAIHLGTGSRRITTAGRDGTVRIWDRAGNRARIVMVARGDDWTSVRGDGTVRSSGEARPHAWWADGMSRRLAGRPDVASNAQEHQGETR